ncbi:ABC transporter permease [Ruficoccus sp. ZRK36]|uniref:ABC transporter permease n=1 Tax=Ruficoccus sp. ZRK36 TaxID=2866311 RepID=UPI001C72C827|nr:ABC transporter permease [Ruficoccus sp. ZRK36]QYY35073.1 ABC transporter permease [Ruficoccus sp. ZRK36]
MNKGFNKAHLLRLRGFLRKEALQIRRDPSSILLALVLPILLLVLLGYGVSLNPVNVPLAWVDDSPSEASRDLRGSFEGNSYYVLTTCASLHEAQQLVETGRVDGIIHLQSDFDRRVARGETAPVQLLLNGVDANRANIVRGYVGATLGVWTQKRASWGTPVAQSGAVVNARLWFNAASESRNFLVPGLIVIIMTVTGTLLTALIIARESERGTLEAILATPLRVYEFLIGKTLPYFVLGMLGFFLSVAGGIFVFGVPLRGSFWLLTLCSSVFLLAALGLGLALSARVRVQFVAAQLSMIIGFLPAFFLSGLIFDLHSTPDFVQALSYLVPARYFVSICQTLFLAGDVWSVVGPALLALSFFGVLFFVLARKNLSLRIKR